MSIANGFLRPADPGDIARSLAHIEFQLRVAGALIASTPGARPPEFPGSLEKWADYTRAHGAALSCMRCESLLTQIASSPDDRGAGGTTFRSARNEVFHGGPIPDDLDSSGLLAIINRNNSNISEILEHHASLVRPPYFFIDGGRHYVLNDYDANSAKYWPAQGPAVDVRDASIVDSLKHRLPRTGMREFENFSGDIERDLRGFAENRDVRVYVDDDAVGGVDLVAQWSRRTSEGADPRIDRFHLGSNSERLWLRNGEARPYREILKTASNWPLLKSRLRSDLEQLQHAQSELSSSIFDTRFVELPYMDQLVRTSASASQNHTPTFAEFCAQLATSAYRFNAGTRLVTFTGEAGAGKTHSLLRFAQESLVADTVNELDDDRPVVLYVSSSGRAANTLDTLIESRVAETRLIDRTGVLALCRAGLLVLVIDGFDELLGFRTYDEPLKAIQPLLDELRGRGTVILSARSSYAETRITSQIAVQDAQAWPPRIDTAEIMPLTEQQVSEALSDVGCADAYEASEPRQRRLITTPFFTASFASWASTSRSIPFIDFVLDSYLRREQRKLQNPDGSDLLSREVLSSTLSEVAEMAALSDSTEISESDLQIAAEEALGAELSLSARRRLTTLCAVSAEWSEDENSFSFAHTVVFEYFLARQLAGKTVAQVVALCSDVPISSLTARLFIQTVDASVVQSVAAGLKFAAQSREIDSRSATEARTSLGSLWAESPQAIVGDSPIFQGADFGQLVVSSGSRARLENCRVDILIIEQGASVALQDSSVRHLDCRGAGISAVACDQATIIDAILAGNAYYGTDLEVRTALGLIAQSGSGLEGAFTYYRKRLQVSGHAPIVLDASSRLPVNDDRRSSWTMTYGKDAWIAFLKDAESRGKLTSTSMPASGRPKERFRIAE